MVSVIWDSEGILLVECLERAATINSEWYVQTLKLKLKGSARQKDESSPHPPWQYHNAHQSYTNEALATMIWTVHPHHPYTTNLTLSDFHLFGLLHVALWEHYFVDNAGTQLVRWAPMLQQKSFMRMTYSVSCKGGKSMLIMKTLWKTNFSFVKGSEYQISVS